MRRSSGRGGGTGIHVLRKSGWKIAHEHRSRLEPNTALDSVESLISKMTVPELGWGETNFDDNA